MGYFRIPFIVLTLLFTSGSVFAFEPSGYPGAVWMVAGREANGIEGTNTQGLVRQGVELLRLDDGPGFQVYGQFNWRFRSINQDYYNSYTPYLGAMVSFKYIDLGMEFGWPHYTEISRELRSNDIFASWYRYWSLTEWRNDRLLKALPLSTWGNASYDLKNEDGSSTMGWIKLEADVLWLPHNFMAGPYVSYSWRLRTRNADYFNMQGVSSGLAIGNGSLSAGVEYAWQQYPELHRKTNSFQFYITYYTAWDLKKLAAVD